MENKPVTIQRLINASQCEEVLRELGFRQFQLHRHDQLVRIELAEEEMDLALRSDVVRQLVQRFRLLGFKYVTLDLKGIRYE